MDESREQEDLKESISNFAKAIISGLKQAKGAEIEPFDTYVDELKEKVQKGKVPFEDRLTHGYQVLLKEIAESKKENK